MLIPKDLFAPKFVQDPGFPSGVVNRRLRLAHGFRKQKRQQEAGAVGRYPVISSTYNTRGVIFCQGPHKGKELRRAPTF